MASTPRLINEAVASPIAVEFSAVASISAIPIDAQTLRASVVVTTGSWPPMDHQTSAPRVVGDGSIGDAS